MATSPSRDSDSGGRTPFDPLDRVHDDCPKGSCFRDDVWDYKEIRPRASHSGRFLDFTRFPEGYRSDMKVYFMLQGRPHHPLAVSSGVGVRRNPATLPSIMGAAGLLVLIARWGATQGLRDFGDWEQGHADSLVEALRNGTHHDEGAPNLPHSLRPFVSLLKKLPLINPLVAHALTFTPWPMQSAREIAEVPSGAENYTPPLAWETWQPLMAAADAAISKWAPIIIEAERAFRDTQTRGEMRGGVSGDRAVAALQDYLNSGGLVPLHTGFGRNGNQPRGAVNYSLLQRKVNLSSWAFSPRSPKFSDVSELLGRAIEGGRVEYGGLLTCRSSWIGEIGLAEAEYLPAVVRGACYVMISSLSGMRDSELQSLRRDSFDVNSIVPSLAAMTYKSEAIGGRPRTWWVPSAVHAAVQVLSELSHTDRLLSRSGRTGYGGEDGEYASDRDIDRLINFVNAAPDERPGRGSDLGLSPIRIPRRNAVNATALRRTLAVYAATYPGADIGIGIQLGKASLRATSGYIRDRKHQATVAITDERVKAVQDDIRRVLFAGEPIAGPSKDQLENLRVQIIADPERANQLIARVAENYHLGVVNDCAYREKTAACGPGGPKLADHFCATTDCANAVFHQAHLPTLDAQIMRFDVALDKPNLHPGLEGNLRRERAKVARRRRELISSDPMEALP